MPVGVVTNPTGKGGFKKGQTGNPGGRNGASAKVLSNLAVAARRYGKMALSTLVDLARHAENENVRLSASIAILDRGYGRPTQSIELATDAPNLQVNFFERLGLGDPATFEADLARVVELKAERERELAALAKSAPTTEPEGDTTA